MTSRRDYKRDNWRDSRDKHRRQVRLRAGLVLGLALIGLIGGLISYFKHRQQEAAVAQVETPVAKPATAVIPPEPPKPPPKPKYEFYNVLKDREVVIGTDEIQSRTLIKPREQEPVKAKVVSTSAAPQRFIVQVGAFASQADADRLKARIAFLGWQARIENSTGADGKPISRVRLGPFKDTGEADRLRKQLTDNGINSIMIGME